jgi:hypothetical protein
MCAMPFPMDIKKLVALVTLYDMQFLDMLPEAILCVL